MATRVLDLDRYRALVVIIGAILGVLAAADVGLRVALGEMPDELLRASFHDARLRDDVAGRVSAVVARRADYTDRPLAVIVGSSSARAGLRPAALAGADGQHHRWLNLAGTGSSFDELRYTFEPLFVSGLDADLAVIAIHPGWFAGRLVGDPALDAILVSKTSRRSWLLFHQGRLNHLARSALTGLRERLLFALGVSFDAVYRPVPDPWTEHAPATSVLDLARQQPQLDMWKRKRWFEPGWYGRAEGEVADATAVIAGTERVARRVVIVLMPESSALRAAMPPEADAALRRSLARLSSPPAVIDLRSAVPDELFADHIHVNERGAERLSTVLAAKLQL